MNIIEQTLDAHLATMGDAIARAINLAARSLGERHHLPLNRLPKFDVVLPAMLETINMHDTAARSQTIGYMIPASIESTLMSLDYVATVNVPTMDWHKDKPVVWYQTTTDWAIKNYIRPYGVRLDMAGWLVSNGISAPLAHRPSLYGDGPGSIQTGPQYDVSHIMTDTPPPPLPCQND